MILYFLRAQRVLLDDASIPRPVWIRYNGFVTSSMPSEAAVMEALTKPPALSGTAEEPPDSRWRDRFAVGLGIVIFVGLLALFIGWLTRAGAGIGTLLGLRAPWGLLVLVVLSTGSVMAFAWTKNKISAVRSIARASQGKRSTDDAWLIRRAIRWSRCPCCGFDVGNLPARDDGATQCAECAAVWNIGAWMDDGGNYEFKFESDNQVRVSGSRQRKPTWTLDARARLVPMLSSIEPTDRAREINLRGGRSLVDVLPTLALTIGVCLAGLVAVLAALRFDPFAAALIGLALAPFLGFVCYRLRYAGLDRSMTRLRRALITEHHCPCCESKLRPEPVVTDGCLVCDTCGSAWNPPDPELHPRA
jgi:hypothetical protein